MTPPDPYWSKFVATVVFHQAADRVAGVLEARSDDGPKDDPYPVLILRLPNGYRVRVNVTQTRLLGELIRKRPAIGDELEIVYHGATGKAPPGLSPVKEFTVAVTKRRNEPPQSAAQTDNPNGEVSENGPRAGGSISK